MHKSPIVDSLFDSRKQSLVLCNSETRNSVYPSHDSRVDAQISSSLNEYPASMVR